ncbi:MAG TPA: flavin reductase family protein [Solirubrobacteraceae bacterium]|jgi:flavin reductase (DIM6/NTAB) family NADH-FMN oxidoreductase RutF|nr:flavin reductase family protein [Solirubrobacteraceae bacterium]
MAGFEAIARRLEYPMFVVTAAADGEIAGCLVGFTTQSGLTPARFIACISHLNHTNRVARRASVLAVHLLSSDDGDLAELFGGQTGDRIGKFERCQWQPGPGGAPILARCSDWFAGRVIERFEAGDHDAFVLEPVAGDAGDGSVRALTSLDAASIQPGHPA